MPHSPQDALGQAESTTGSGARPAAAGVLVIHGMGRQQRFEALDAFVRGLLRVFREKNPRSDVEASHEILTDGGAALHYVRFRDPASGRRYDVFELYWAPLKVAKISA